MHVGAGRRASHPSQQQYPSCSVFLQYLALLFLMTLYFLLVSDDDPPLVSAELVNDEPEINYVNPPPTAPTASMVGSTTTTSAAQQQSQAPAPTASTTTTTTTYTIPAPAAAATGVSAATTVIGYLGRCVRNSLCGIVYTEYLLLFSSPLFLLCIRNPKGMQCPHCQRQMVTRVRDQIDCVTITAFIILLLLFWPLFWLPFCVPSCKTSLHYCPLCNRKIGETSACS